MLKRGWFSGSLWKPKNLHSLDHLRYLYTVLSKNQVVQDSNRSLLVESLRSIAEILIWGDQNDSSVFDFFLEKNMLSFFLRIMKQKCGSYVCVQLLQTLNILFENIRNETSLYYLLSNNHVNSIIVHKFDFSDEEVMAYYISFLKTLSFKLNSHTIHFFYNEHTNDFPLYTEAIKFFNHPESMVRIAVRTLTLNVYNVEDKSMLRFIRDKTAAPYFSNLVWFIGNHILELDVCIRTDIDHSSRDKLSNLVAEHLDHLHYLNDILQLNIAELNQVLAHHLLNRLLLPLLIYSLTNNPPTDAEKPRISRVVALFLLAQVFLIFSYQPLMQVLCKILFHGDTSIFNEDFANYQSQGFIPPAEPLETSFSKTLESPPTEASDATGEEGSCEIAEVSPQPNINITDEEKEQMKSLDINLWSFQSAANGLSSKPFLVSIMKALDCSDNDYAALFSLCLLYAVGHNEGVNKELLAVSLGLTDHRPDDEYTSELIESLLKIVSLSAEYNSKIRAATLEMVLTVLKNFLSLRSDCVSSKGAAPGLRIKDQDLALLEGAREEATLQLRNFYKGEEIFLDMFEDEWRDLNRKPLNVEFLLQDASVLLPPTGTPLTGIDFNKRLPCGEVEKARRYMRVYFLIRDICLGLREEKDCLLPLTNPDACVQVSDVLDLNNSDLIACVVITRDSQRTRRFLVIDVIQLILVEPDHKRLGWGVAKFVGFLQDLEVTGDKDDSRVLHITIHRPSVASSRPATPLLAAKFIFDDHIRCMAAKQRLTKGRAKARLKKLHQIARLLDMPTHLQPCPSPPTHALGAMRQEAQRRSSIRSSNESRGVHPKHKLAFQQGRGPGIALKREVTPNGGVRDRKEDIPLEDMAGTSTSLVAHTGQEPKLINICQPTMSIFPVAGQVPYRGIDQHPVETSYTLPQCDPVQRALADARVKPRTDPKAVQSSPLRKDKGKIETI